jgi:hypothetical protein
MLVHHSEFFFKKIKLRKKFPHVLILKTEMLGQERFFHSERAKKNTKGMVAR